MAKKKDNAIYAPGELSRVRDKLGVKDDEEAKRMAQKLGGEVGTERSAEQDKKPARRETVDLVVGGKGRPSHRIDVLGDEEAKNAKSKARSGGPFPGDDPSVPAKLGYRERIKIDQYAGQPMFDIKTSMQILVSIFSFFKEPADFVNPRFVTKRLNEYYEKIEKLVTLSRNLFPKNNFKRNHQLKRMSTVIFKMLDTLRSWNIEQMIKHIADLQVHPRNVTVHDFTELLQDIYKPLFILADINSDNLKTAFKLIYKILYLESPMEAKEKYQDIIRSIISTFMEVRREVQFGMYPLLMKLLSDRFIAYERFFIERRNRYMAFLKVTMQDQLSSEDFATEQVDAIDVEKIQKEVEEEEEKEAEGQGGAEAQEDEDPNDPKVIARKAREEAEKMEKKALDQGQTALEAIFPKAGWEKLAEYPDLYPYFAKIYNLKHGYELIAATDPLQQVCVLMHILDDICIGLRYVNMGTIISTDGSTVKLGVPRLFPGGIL